MNSQERPAEIAKLSPIVLDVRDDLARGEHPLAKITRAARALGDDEALVLRTPFEPVPLYDVLGRQGFAHWTERRADDDWSVWFYRGAVPTPTTAVPADRASSTSSTSPERVQIVDVRGLEPPLPLVRVLERLETLPRDETLVVLHERRPTFLYPQLDERGFVHETDEPKPGVVRIRIRHAPSSERKTRA